MPLLVNVSIGVRRDDKTQFAHLRNLFRRQDADVPEHPALHRDIDLSIYFVEHVEHVRPDGDHADAVLGARQTQLFRAFARQPGSEIETGPAGIWPRPGAYFIFRRWTDIDEEAAHAKEIVTEAAARKPARPGLG